MQAVLSGINKMFSHMLFDVTYTYGMALLFCPRLILAVLPLLIIFLPLLFQQQVHILAPTT